MRQRSGSWELRVYAGRDPVSGKKRWVSRTVAGGKREAARALAKLSAEVGGRVVAPTSATVADLLEQWFAFARDDFSPKTVLETRGFMDRNLLPNLGSMPLSRLGTHDVDRLYRTLRKEGAQDGGPLAPATVRRIHGILRRALDQGVRWNWIPANPAAAATAPRVDARELVPPAPSDVATLFALAQERDPEFATFVMLAAATGARRSELVALRWPAVDLEAGTVTIRGGIVIGPDGLVEKDTKTHRVRRVALDPTTLQQLKDHLGRVVERAGACGVMLDGRAFVFSHEIDGSSSWRPDSTSRAFRRLRVRAGCEHVRLHDLRHYVATRLLVAGVDVRTVAGRLGHRNASTTLNVYAHFVAESDRDAANVLGRLFDHATEDRTPTE